MTEHVLTIEIGEDPPFHGVPMPRADASCSCGGWSRIESRYDAADPDGSSRREVLDDHATHVAMALSPVQWPTSGDGLHPLLNRGLYDHQKDRTSGEYRVHRVPSESSGLVPGTSLPQVLEAISEIYSQLSLTEDADGEVSAPLEQGPLVAAMHALVEQLRFMRVQVQAWRVIAKGHPSTTGGPDWPDSCYAAFHTEAEAEAQRDRMMAKRDQQRPLYVSWGPAPLYTLYLPGARQEVS